MSCVPVRLCVVWPRCGAGHPQDSGVAHGPRRTQDHSSRLAHSSRRARRCPGPGGRGCGRVELAGRAAGGAKGVARPRQRNAGSRETIMWVPRMRGLAYASRPVWLQAPRDGKGPRPVHAKYGFNHRA
eukprot:2910372-Prymnesium_polylepis.2